MWLILVVALGLRLIYGLSLAPTVTAGSDQQFYLRHGYALVSGQDVPGVALHLLAQPPVYFIVNGIAQVIFTPEGAIVAVRVAQAIMGTLTVYCVYRIARHIGGERAGWIAAAFVAINPIFILETGQILTETTYVLGLSAAFAVYVSNLTPRPPLLKERGRQAASPPDPLSLGRGGDKQPHPPTPSLKRGEGEKTNLTPQPPLRKEERGSDNLRLWLIAGALFGLATLTRAVLLAFPLGLALHLLIVYRGRAWGKIAALLVAYALVVSTWTVYNLARWQRFVIAGEGLPSFLFVGATGWADPEVVDQQLNETLGTVAPDATEERQEAYLEAAGSTISADVGGYVRHRISELVGAYVQPHGTTLFAGESLRELAVKWLREDRSLAGIGQIIGGEQFFPKLLLYVFHAVTLIGGLIGAWRSRRQWRLTLPLLGFIAYVTLVHFFLLALPRYIFPTMLCWIVLGSLQFTGNRRELDRNRESGILT